MIPLEIFMCISCSPAGMNVQHVHEVLLEARRGRQSPRERKLEGEVLGTNKSLVRAASVLLHRPTSLASRLNSTFLEHNYNTLLISKERGMEQQAHPLLQLWLHASYSQALINLKQVRKHSYERRNYSNWNLLLNIPETQFYMANKKGLVFSMATKPSPVPCHIQKCG